MNSNTTRFFFELSNAATRARMIDFMHIRQTVMIMLVVELFKMNKMQCNELNTYERIPFRSLHVQYLAIQIRTKYEI